MAESVDLPAGRQARWSVIHDPMTCSVYALASLSQEYIYVGLSTDVSRRIEEHQRGKEPTTRHYRPFEVLLVETQPDRLQARQREKFLKSGVGKEFLKDLRAKQRKL